MAISRASSNNEDSCCARIWLGSKGGGRETLKIQSDFLYFFFFLFLKRTKGKKERKKKKNNTYFPKIISVATFIPTTKISPSAIASPIASN